MLFFFFKQKTAYEMRISDWSSDVCSSDLLAIVAIVALGSKVSPGAVFLVLLLAAAIGFGLPMMIIGRLRDRRIRKLEEQFPLALEVFVRGLRAGHPISAALELLTADLPDPIGSEFGIVVDEVTYGQIGRAHV